MTAVRETRNAHELAAQRAAANEVLTPAYRADPYEREKAAAVLRALDWLQGMSMVTPVSGMQLVEPTEAAIHDERVYAEETEARALRSGLDGTFPGMVGVVLSWFHRRQFTEAPY